MRGDPNLTWWRVDHGEGLYTFRFAGGDPDLTQQSVDQVRVWMRWAKKAGEDVGMDIGKKVGEVRMGIEEEEVGEEVGKAGDEGCTPCMLPQAQPLQLGSIWLWEATSCCCLGV